MTSEERGANPTDHGMATESSAQDVEAEKCAESASVTQEADTPATVSQSDSPGAPQSVEALSRGKDNAGCEANMCRICFGNEEVLCAPCPCRGSVRFVHMSCLREEFLSRREWTNLRCSVCRYEFTGPAALELATLGRERAATEWGPDEVGTFITEDHLGRLLMCVAGDLSNAEVHLRRALDGLERTLGHDDPETLIAASNLGTLLQRQGCFDVAEPLVRRAWEGSVVAQGEHHHDTLVLCMNYAVVLRELGRHEEAERLLRSSLAGLDALPGANQDALAAASHLSNLLLHLRKDLGEAEPLARRAWEGTVRTFGPEHPRTLKATADLGALLLARGRPGDSEPLLRDALKGLRNTLGAKHPQTLAVAGDLGEALFSVGRKVESEEFLQAVWAERQATLGEDHLRTAAAAHNLGVLLQDLRRPVEAAQLLEAAWMSRKTKLGVAHSRTLASAARLGPLLLQMRNPQAASVLRSLWEGNTERLGGSHSKTVASARRLAACLMEWELIAEARGVLKRALLAADSSSGESEQVSVLSSALLGADYDASRWRELFCNTVQQPSATELLMSDLQALDASAHEEDSPERDQNAGIPDSQHLGASSDCGHRSPSLASGEATPELFLAQDVSSVVDAVAPRHKRRRTSTENIEDVLCEG
eukprot:TRINITY_DN28351_c0_g2_i1.p1 TRINITY_DN28351_c0_g2~~TRINITY_DN28351_c0_g2_i1.p1  ORF type:complete len:650 (-),score=68.27 TRINITY_DN28351_c0_g2_i1:337-2286(-)